MHLVRCSSCRSILIDSDVRCPFCGIDCTSFKFFRASWLLGKWVLLPVVVGLVIAFAWLTAEKKRIEREEEAQTQQRG